MFIVNPLAGRKMTFKTLFMTHPPTEDRIRRLRSQEWHAA
jgi:Zn-dependent protease with chaperone function